MNPRRYLPLYDEVLPVGLVNVLLLPLGGRSWVEDDMHPEGFEPFSLVREEEVARLEAELI